MKIKLFIFFIFCVFSLPAQYSKKIRDLENERKATLIEIEETNKLLKENTLTISNALNRLSLLVQQINSRKKIIQLLNQEIASIDEEIHSKELQIKTLENNLEEKKQYYATSIKKMYSHKNNQGNLLFIFSSQSFSQSYHRMMYMKAYSEWLKKQAEEISGKQKIINQQKKLLVEQRENKLNLLEERQLEENQLSNEEASKIAEVRTLENSNKKLQDELKIKQQQASALNRQIEKIIAEEVLKSVNAAKTKTGEKRTAEVEGGYVMTESERALSSNFVNNKGKLPFPLKGNYRVVGNFGVHQHKELSRVVTNNNGIDIETTAGNDARTVFNGVVSRVFTLPGYNNSIIIRHGNYLTLYSNLEQVYVKQGDNVATGQSLGKIYTDREKGNSTLLHFEIWKEQTKLNPLSWIN